MQFQTERLIRWRCRDWLKVTHLTGKIHKSHQYTVHPDTTSSFAVDRPHCIQCQQRDSVSNNGKLNLRFRRRANAAAGPAFSEASDTNWKLLNIERLRQSKIAAGFRGGRWSERRAYVVVVVRACVWVSVCVGGGDGVYVNKRVCACEEECRVNHCERERFEIWIAYRPQAPIQVKIQFKISTYTH